MHCLIPPPPKWLPFNDSCFGCVIFFGSVKRKTDLSNAPTSAAIKQLHFRLPLLPLSLLRLWQTIGRCFFVGQVGWFSLSLQCPNKQDQPRSIIGLKTSRCQIFMVKSLRERIAGRYMVEDGVIDDMSRRVLHQCHPSKEIRPYYYGVINHQCP